jgi:hypothetical protein
MKIKLALALVALALLVCWPFETIITFCSLRAIGIIFLACRGRQ